MLVFPPSPRLVQTLWRDPMLDIAPPSIDPTPPPDPVTASKRLLANRANAQLSTGPRTPAGKARSAQNALLHGLRARLDPAPLVPEPERPDYAHFLQDLCDNLDPQSPLEDLLVQRISLLGWKLPPHA